MGANRVQNVAAPVAATDAVNKAYVDALSGGSGARIDQVEARMSQAFRDIDRHSQGIAVAMAMSGLSVPSAKSFALGVNMGFYQDKQAFALQGAMRLNEFVTLSREHASAVSPYTRHLSRI